MELVLVLGLIVLMFGVVVLNYGGYGRARQIEEGIRRFATVLRMARAESASRGRRLQLAFDEETGDCRILWEPDPLGEPGRFADYTACTWLHHLPNGLIRVSSSYLTGPSAYRTLGLDQMREGAAADRTLETVMFYPDGSSDSAVFELAAPADPPESLRAVVELDGLNGIITTKNLTREELEELQDEQADRLSDGR